jgi:hypothetical protein
MRQLLYFILVITISLPSFSQESQPLDKDAAYTKTINSRADKIVGTLGITDNEKATRVSDIIASHYRNTNDVYTRRDEDIKAVKAKQESKEAIAAEVKSLQEASDSKIAEIHDSFLKSLSSELTPEQVVKVKDGLTYNVLNVTYNAFVDMIPTLTTEQKQQIMTWLVEAREHAMDAESSEKKHAWFGKYKGRINNYLAARGYDLNKEGVEWQKRRDAAKTAKKQ